MSKCQNKSVTQLFLPLTPIYIWIKKVNIKEVRKPRPRYIQQYEDRRGFTQTCVSDVRPNIINNMTKKKPIL